MTKTLDVLCFGDSLTGGWTHGGQTKHPYSSVLKAYLNSAFAASDTKVSVYTNGVAGDVASWPAFKERLTNECNKRFYDWVIMLGGTNDIAYGLSPAQIFAALKDAWTVPLAKGSCVLALTVPETAPASARRDELNALIKSYAAPRLHVFDLHARIPHASLSERDRALLWDDAVHLSPDGYDFIGGQIADALLPAMAAQEDADKAAATAKKRPARTRDDMVFDEEVGNPGRLSEGYVVVRKKDLY